MTSHANQLEQQFDGLWSAVALADQAELLSLEELEPLFVAVLSFIDAHPAVLAYAEARFLRWMDGSGNDAPWELIAYCMHALRLPSVETKARQLVCDVRSRNVMSSILAAYAPDWSDLDVYLSLRARVIKPG